MSETNGRIRLSWAQVAWGISVLVLILSSWADLRAQIVHVQVENDYLRERVSRLERKVGLN